MDLDLALSLLGIGRIRASNFDGVSFAPPSTHEKACPREVGGHVSKDFRGYDSNPHGPNRSISVSADRRNAVSRSRQRLRKGGGGLNLLERSDELPHYRREQLPRGALAVIERGRHSATASSCR
jgi:hypothetical protein